MVTSGDWEFTNGRNGMRSLFFVISLDFLNYDYVQQIKIKFKIKAPITMSVIK